MSNNYETQLKELEAKQAEERRKLELKHAVLTALGELAQDREVSVFVNSLYGRVGTISYKTPFSPILLKGKAPDTELLRDLLGKFPPIEKVSVRDGCLSFRPAGEWKGEVTRVYPVTIQLETYTQQIGKFEWNTRIDGHVWEIEVEFPLHQLDIGRLELRYREVMGGREVAVCEFYPAHGAQRVRWASGGREYPNSFTVFWQDADGRIDIPAMVKAVQP